MRSLQATRRLFLKSWPSFGKCLMSTKAAAASGQLNLPHYHEKSALYISAAKGHESVFQRVIMPELDLDEQLGAGRSLDDKPHQGHLALRLNLERRAGFQPASTEIDELRSNYLKIKQLRGEIESLEGKKEEISAQINKLMKQAKQRKVSKDELMQTDEFKRLHESGNAIKLDMHKVQDVLEPLETQTHLACLALPNQLHAASLLSQPELSGFSFQGTVGEKPLAKTCLFSDAQKDSHLSKYYIGRLSKLEQALVSYFYSKLNAINEAQPAAFPVLEHLKSVSMFKSPVVEGCGLEFRDSTQLFNVMNANLESDHQHHVELLHLTGACSLASLVLNFVRTQISAKYLPWTVFTNAKGYSPLWAPVHGHHAQSNNFDMLGLFEKPSELVVNHRNSPPGVRDDRALLEHFEKLGKAYMSQTAAELKEFASNDCKITGPGLLQAKEVDKYLVDVLKLFMYLYKDLGVQLKFQPVPSDKLSRNESLAIEVLALSTLDHKYHTVGVVSLLGDFVSQRLQIRVQSEAKKPASDQHAHASMVYTRLVNLDQLLSILTGISAERLDNFHLPKALEPFYLK